MLRPVTLLGLCAGLAAALATAAPAHAQKVDAVVLRNGDHMTGEIKKLDRASLTYSTDDMGTLAIEWDKIVQITSPRYFEVEDVDGARYYGTLGQGSDTGQVVVAVASFSDTLALAKIVRVSPIGRSFFARLDGYINVGFTLQRANDLRQLSVATSVQHRSRQARTELQSSTYFQDQSGIASTTRNSLSLTQQRPLKQRWLVLGAGQLEQNDELDLDLRGLLTAGGGRYLVQNNRAQVLLGGGLTYTNERFVGSSATSNLEALVTFSGEYFRLDSPKSDLQATLSLYPSLTDPGRVRADFDARLSHEVLKDFTLGLTVFDRFDSRPPVTASKNDFGVTFTAGWTF
ncbi:MAG TPA: DUF481 domain-containing protein [Gemmatimonadales bacterium]|nr:DUF481 domain-containing protein [Gemmatimonadales bacterium]